MFSSIGQAIGRELSNRACINAQILEHYGFQPDSSRKALVGKIELLPTDGPWDEWELVVVVDPFLDKGQMFLSSTTRANPKGSLLAIGEIGSAEYHIVQFSIHKMLENIRMSLGLRSPEYDAKSKVK